MNDYDDYNLYTFIFKSVSQNIKQKHERFTSVNLVKGKGFFGDHHVALTSFLS